MSTEEQRLRMKIEEAQRQARRSRLLSNLMALAWLAVMVFVWVVAARSSRGLAETRQQADSLVSELAALRVDLERFRMDVGDFRVGVQERLTHYDSVVDLDAEEQDPAVRRATAVRYREDAVAHLGQQDYEAAIALLEGARQLTPDDLQTHALLAEAYARADRWAESLEPFDRAIELSGDRPDPFLHNTKAYSLAHLGYYEDAVESADAALALRPNWSAAHYNRAFALSQLSRAEEAREATLAAMELAPGRAEHHALLGLSHVLLGQLEEARQEFARARALDESYSGTPYYESLLYERLGSTEEASRARAEALALGFRIPPSPQVR